MYEHSFIAFWTFFFLLESLSNKKILLVCCHMVLYSCLARTFHMERIDRIAAKVRNSCFQPGGFVNNAIRFSSCASVLVIPSWPSDTTTKARSFYQYLGVGSCTNSAQTPQDGDRKTNHGSHVLRNSEQQTEQLRASERNDRKFAYTCSKSAVIFLVVLRVLLLAVIRAYTFTFVQHYFFFCRNTNATCKTSIPAPLFDPFLINLHSFVPVLSFLVHLHLV